MIKAIAIICCLIGFWSTCRLLESPRTAAPAIAAGYIHSDERG